MYALRTVNAANGEDPIQPHEMRLHPTLLDFTHQVFCMFVAGLWNGDGTLCLW